MHSNSTCIELITLCLQCMLHSPKHQPSMMKCAQCQTLQWGDGGRYIHCPKNIYFSLSEIKRYFGGYSCTKAY